jgi:GNAT superfamily N-acetyltransferase
MLMTDICIKQFSGAYIRPYLSSIARLSAEVFREYPFLCDTHENWELEFLQKYAESDEAIAVIVFDGSTIVGASTGIPLHEESEAYLRPFKQKNIDPTHFFHFGESLLLKPYRNRGIGHHFFDLREDYVKRMGKYTSICFCSVDRPEHDPLRPHDHRPLDDFWRKRGFTHHKEMKCFLSWKDLGDEVETVKELSFWIKEIH